MAEKGATATTMDVVAALRKRLVNQGVALSDDQLFTLAIDVMTVVNTDAANATSHAATEIAKNIPRPFVRGV